MFTPERAPCLAPALLLLGGNTLFSHPVTLSPKQTQSFKLSYCAGVWQEGGRHLSKGGSEFWILAFWLAQQCRVLILHGLLLASLEETQEMALGCQTQWCTPVILECGKLKQGMGGLESSWSTWATQQQLSPVLEGRVGS